jgi:hypothetical protein
MALTKEAEEVVIRVDIIKTRKPATTIETGSMEHHSRIGSMNTRKLSFQKKRRADWYPLRAETS